MEHTRYQSTSLYSSSSQHGGSNKKSPNVTRLRYSPPDIDNSIPVRKLLKANRLLQKELQDMTSKLKEVSYLLEIEKKKNKFNNLHI